ncbi:MAG: transcription antitermination factor NusB [Fimbriimonadales bacterium]
MEVNFRHEARLAAVMALYAIDVGKTESDIALDTACTELELPRRWRRVAAKTVAAVLEKRKEIDKTISDAAVGYTLDRLAALDRAVLRLGVYEVLYGDMPKAVAINEAVEIAKEFSTEDSGKFVNGILGKLSKA